ncbi:hypothetical protein BGW36DRAFT_398251 [Talaromyces proteolyticus]|uniref:Uncharacterized protein n=1 Tax=Talaromyces proteolyticus TaxID=1131652 RepID=A0AAD4KLP2_9EURO|nr:uncharacterized protein BGW36DRAFT_398251 [Talaromyces proteolyticus]KAH8694890.1 hypothetical protein BGW36DRAFT_398251 [Talaromyces proteolyticus]
MSQLTPRTDQTHKCYPLQIQPLPHSPCVTSATPTHPQLPRREREHTEALHPTTLKGSTLKTVMRKIFGRKRLSNLDGDETDEGLSPLRFEKSDVSAQPDRTAVVGHPRTNSSPSAPNHKNSLVVSRLSSASSDNLAATNSDSRIEIPPQTVRRRATLPSLILSDDGHMKERTLSLISPVSTRPVSAMSVMSAMIPLDEKTDNHGDAESFQSKKAHRRSRSADDLKKLVRHHRMSPIQWRRGNNEKNGWRTSVLELEGRNTADRNLQQSSSNRSNTPTSRDKITPDIETSDPPSPNVPESAPFHFENLIASMADPDASIEQRMTTMEVKIMDLEFAIAKIQGTDCDAFPKTVNNTPEKAKVSDTTAEPSSAASETSSQSSASFGGDARPISTATLRPSISFSQPPPPWYGGSSSSLNLHGISIEQYSALVTLVRREQTARKALENQVALLQEEMQSFRRSSGMPASPPGTLYPIPSPDSDDARYRRRRDASSSRKDSETSTEARAYEGRQWESPHYRANIETTSRNTAANMI